MYVLSFHSSLDYELKSTPSLSCEFSEHFNLSLGKSQTENGMGPGGLLGLE